MIGIQGKKTGNLVPHVLSGHWRMILPSTHAVQARKAAMALRRSTHKFHSAKCNRVVMVSTLLERDRAFMLEADPDVILYEEAPFLLQYDVENGTESIVPSFIVLRIGGRLVVEDVVTLAIAEHPRQSKRIVMEKMVLERYGYEFLLVTEDYIPHRQGNRVRLSGHKRSEFSGNGPATGSAPTLTVQQRGQDGKAEPYYIKRRS